MRIFVRPGSSKGSSLTQKGRVLKLDLGNPFKVAITREEDLPPPPTHIFTRFYVMVASAAQLQRVLLYVQIMLPKVEHTFHGHV